jgi:hypothetical protein
VGRRDKFEQFRVEVRIQTLVTRSAQSHQVVLLREPTVSPRANMVNI